MFVNALLGLGAILQSQSVLTYVGNGGLAMVYSGNVPMPAGVIEGDLLLMCAPSNTVTPSGWTLETTTRTNWRIFSKVATSSEPSNVDVTGSGLNRRRAHAISAFRNYSSYSVLSSNTNDDFIGGTTSFANCIVAYFSYVSLDTSAVPLIYLTNADLANITIRLNQRSTTSDGGGAVLVTADKVSAGSFGAASVSKGPPAGLFLPFTIIINPL